MKKICLVLTVSIGTLSVGFPAAAQEAGDTYLRVATARTKLVDKGTVATGGVVNPAAGYRTRETYHGILTAGYFITRGVSVEASVSSPVTTDNVPAGALTGLPNLGDDEFTMVTFGANVQPFNSRVSPSLGAGFVRHFTTQERDGLGVGLNIPNAYGPYVQAGVDYTVTSRWGAFASVRKAWYDTNATGLLPLDAMSTKFSAISARAELNPITVQIGLTTRFGRRADASPQPTMASDRTRWTVRAGLTSLSLADKVDLTVGGARYLGAGLSTYEHWTPTVQIGRFLTQHVALNLTVGIPPSIDVHGAGSIGALPKLGEITYGPTALTAQYHLKRRGRIRPYVGAGASYMIVFDTKDGAFQNLKVKNDMGWAVDAGSDFMVSNHVAIFVDVKKAFLRPTTTGNFMGSSVAGKTRLDPWAFSGGFSLHL